MTTGEDHSQLAVSNLCRKKQPIDRRFAPEALRCHPLRAEPVDDFPMPYDVESFVAGDAINPGRRRLRHSLNLPGLESLNQGCLNHIFDEFEIVQSEHTREDSHQLS